MAGLSKLRAVNIALENIGESSVNTLVGSADAFVVTAIAVLEETTRDVCEEVWNFNRDVEYSMAVDVSGNIPVSSDMISVDGSYKNDNFQVRQGKLYDAENQTFIFTEPQKCDIVWELDFEDLPQYVRKYVAIRAARTFNRRIIGDSDGERMTEQDEARARITAKRHDSKNRDRTIWQDYGSGLHRIKQRRIY